MSLVDIELLVWVVLVYEQGADEIRDVSSC